MLIARDRFNPESIQGPSEMGGLTGMPMPGNMPPINRPMGSPMPNREMPTRPQRPSFFGGLKSRLSGPGMMRGISRAAGMMGPQRKPLQMPNFDRSSVPMGGNQSMQRQNMMQRPMQRPMRMMSY
jgi:hypothetical protein